MRGHNTSGFETKNRPASGPQPGHELAQHPPQKTTLDFALFADGHAWWVGLGPAQLTEAAGKITKANAWGAAGKTNSFGSGVL